MQNIVSDVLSRRRDRTIAIILGVKERECDDFLPREVSQKLRKIILDQMNEYHGFVMDVCQSLDTNDEVVLNEHYLDLIDEIHRAIFRDPRTMMVAGDNG